jgi:hypothetical protein
VIGREDKTENDLFFVCSVIEYIGRETKNRRIDIVNLLGVAELERLFSLADIYHCEPLESISADLIKKHGIKKGSFDNVATCKYAVPTHFDIAKVYKRLIAAVSAAQGILPVSALIEVYNSKICPLIDDYNSSMYYENPEYVLASYNAGMAVSDGIC